MTEFIDDWERPIEELEKEILAERRRRSRPYRGSAVPRL
jgi:hypothetical protein